MEPEERARILAEMPVEEAGEIRELLAYGEESAGGIMTTALVSVREAVTAARAIEEVRRQGREVEDCYTVYVVDRDDRFVGTVPLDDLILAAPEDPVSSLVEPAVAAVRPNEDQEELARLMTRYNLPAVPVVESGGRLVGRVTFDDVLDVHGGGTDRGHPALRRGFGRRVAGGELAGGGAHPVFPWLVLNLATATAAAMVVYLYADTVESAVILAVVMPVIAGMGGNAGSQALAVDRAPAGVARRCGRRPPDGGGQGGSGGIGERGGAGKHRGRGEPGGSGGGPASSDWSCWSRCGARC